MMNEYVLKSVVVIISISFLFVNTFRKSFSSKIGITVRVQIDEQQIENFGFATIYCQQACIIGTCLTLNSRNNHIILELQSNSVKLYLSLAGINACYYLIYHKLHSSFQKHNICNHPCCCQLLLLHQLLQHAVC